jgi:hypothetical protein
MSNPIITVISALYGGPGATVDVTAAVQSNFDHQYENNTNNLAYALRNIQPSLFNIPDPAPGAIKAFTIVYNLPTVGTAVFMRGAQDSQNLTLTAGPSTTIQVTQAIYATNDTGLDVTDKLNAYFRDPGNSSALTISNPAFLDALTDGSDLAPGTTKYFSVSYTSAQVSKYVCGYDGQIVNIV